MWPYLFVVGAWLTITPPAQLVSDTTSVVLVEFSRNMGTQGLLNTNNYTLKDETNKSRNIYSVHILNELDNIIIADTSLIALVTQKLEYRKEYTMTVVNVRDKQGNIITSANNKGWFFFNGFVPSIGESSVGIE